jgi:hypothetical protein
MSYYEMDEQVYLEMEYCLRPRPVCCAHCGIADVNAQARLEEDGWLLGVQELCPICFSKQRMREAIRVFNAKNEAIREVQPSEAEATLAKGTRCHLARHNHNSMRTETAGMRESLSHSGTFKKAV